MAARGSRIHNTRTAFRYFGREFAENTKLKLSFPIIVIFFFFFFRLFRTGFPLYIFFSFLLSFYQISYIFYYLLCICFSYFPVLPFIHLSIPVLPVYPCLSMYHLYTLRSFFSLSLLLSYFDFIFIPALKNI